ncbi:MAG: energy transducer TonB [Ferruginibacter sp.]
MKKKARVGTYQVIVKFIVSKNGKIKGIVAETSYGHGMEKEVIRIIKEGPDWEPAMQNGHPVNAYRRQPVTFIVSEE